MLIYAAVKAVTLAASIMGVIGLAMAMRMTIESEHPDQCGQQPH